MKATGSIARSRSARLAAGALLGAGCGLLLFLLTSVHGMVLFLIAGASVGVVVGWAFGLATRSLRLTEVKVTVPQISQLTFVVDTEARQVAWRLFVETVTRVSTQPLDDGDGLLREALTSLHGLFATVREILRNSRPSARIPGVATVEYLAVTMLNRELRPFLSRWHPRLTAHEQVGTESDWPDAAAFRAALRSVREHVSTYALGFAKLANVVDAEAMVLSYADGRSEASVQSC